MIMAPIPIVLSITGGIYIFKADITEFARRDLHFVEPRGSAIGYQARVDAALAAHPGSTPLRLQVHPDADRATIVTLRPKPAEGPAASA